MDWIKLIAKLGNPLNVVLIVKVIKEIRDAVEAILRLIKVLSNGNNSEELQAALRDVNVKDKKLS